MEGHVRVLEWLGGVPQECVYHRVPAGIAKRDRRGAMRWHRRFRALRRHYGFRSYVYEPGPTGGEAAGGPEEPDRQARVGGGAETDGRTPGGRQDDSLAVAVERLTGSFWSGLRFKGLSEADAQYAAWRDGSAEAWDHGSRGEVEPTSRMAAEREALRPLPQEDFDFSVYRAVRVPAEGYVLHGACFYRAPAEWVSRRAELHASRDEVWLASQGKRVVTHRRSYRPGAWLPERPG